MQCACEMWHNKAQQEQVMSAEEDLEGNLAISARRSAARFPDLRVSSMSSFVSQKVEPQRNIILGQTSYDTESHDYRITRTRIGP